MSAIGMVERRGEPYVGPRSFRAEDRHRFFGREREARELVDHWSANPLTVLCGPSGVGKTSLLRAGVVPLLDPDRMDLPPIGRVSRVRSFPSAALREGHNPHVFAVLSSWSPYESPADLSGLTIPAFLRRRRPQRHDQYGDPMLSLVAIDRAEDLFADPGGAHTQGEDFLRQLAHAMKEDPYLRVLMVLRDDQLATLKRQAGIFRRPVEYPLSALEPGPAVEAACGPLRGTGLRFAEGAAETLVDDLRTVRLGTPLGEEIVERLPLVEPLQLQVVCSTLWSALPRGESVITVDHVRELADADRSLAVFCDRMIEEVSHEVFRDESELLRAKLRAAFVTEWGSRNVVSLGLTETAGLPDRVIRALVERRILKLEERPMGGRLCELSHDRLVQAIMRDGAGKRASDPTDPVELRRLAELALSEGDFERAATYAEVALQRSGGDIRRRAEAESLLGDIAFQSDDLEEAAGRYGHAAALLQSVPGGDSAVAMLLTAIGRIRIGQGRFEPALRDLEAALRRRPDDPIIQTELAWALWYGGHVNGAMDVLDAVLAREGDTEEALRARGEIMADLGRPAPALQDLDRLRPHHSPSTRSAYALALALEGKVKEAAAIAPPVERERSGAVLLRVARIEEAAGNATAAASLARRAKERDTRPPLPRALAVEADRLIPE
ncbi:tetratricopeptide repeat protein [Nonomuraea lactucae]|uniref:tetratricopeptide repeat protein n=1 Tax=Nonomuraea lactucae TaxID=2249762 RepID=UPI0013B3DF3B|nr:tetratricopeptide repeat protein [Nonomuraea lactucae]